MAFFPSVSSPPPSSPLQDLPSGLSSEARGCTEQQSCSFSCCDKPPITLWPGSLAPRGPGASMQAVCLVHCSLQGTPATSQSSGSHVCGLPRRYAWGVSSVLDPAFARKNVENPSFSASWKLRHRYEPQVPLNRPPIWTVEEKHPAGPIY